MSNVIKFPGKWMGAGSAPRGPTQAEQMARLRRELLLRAKPGTTIRHIDMEGNVTETVAQEAATRRADADEGGRQQLQGVEPIDFHRRLAESRRKVGQAERSAAAIAREQERGREAMQRHLQARAKGPWPEGPATTPAPRPAPPAMNTAQNYPAGRLPEPLPELRLNATQQEAEAFATQASGVFRRFVGVGGPFEVGQLLWVAEEWARYQLIHDTVRGDGRAWTEVGDGEVGYRADGHDTIEDFRRHVRMMAECRAVEIDGDAWRSAEEMPRWASRSLVELTAVTVEQTDAGLEMTCHWERVDPPRQEAPADHRIT